jgi:hypothetical protein
MSAAMRARNRRLTILREQIGMTQGEFVRAASLHLSQYVALETMRARPFKADGVTWSECASGAASFHGVSPEWIWPDEILPIMRRAMRLEASAIEREAPNPAQRLMAEATAKELRDWKAKLTADEAAVITARFEKGKKLGEVDQRSGERIRQVEMQALRKLRRAAFPSESYPALAGRSQIDEAIVRAIEAKEVEAARRRERRVAAVWARIYGGEIVHAVKDMSSTPWTVVCGVDLAEKWVQVENQAYFPLCARCERLVDGPLPRRQWNGWRASQQARDERASGPPSEADARHDAELNARTREVIAALDPTGLIEQWRSIHSRSRLRT